MVAPMQAPQKAQARMRSWASWKRWPMAASAAGQQQGGADAFGGPGEVEEQSAVAPVGAGLPAMERAAVPAISQAVFAAKTPAL